MKKRLSGLFAIALAVVSILIFTTCSVGLGVEVDIETPTLSFSYPDQNVIMRGNFVIQGDAADDTVVNNIVVALHKKGDSIAMITQAANYDETTKKWTTTIQNTYSDTTGWLYPDGEYLIKTTATDTSGRNTTIERSYYIDNTMPMVVLTRPATKGETETPDPYGSDVTFSGTLYDAHDCSELVIDFYYADASNVLTKIDGATYTTSSVNQNWEIAIPSENYNKLVEKIPTAKEFEPVKFYYTLTAYDSAYSYKGDGATQEVGNATSHYYLYDDVSALLSTGEKFPSRSLLSDFDAGIVENGTSRSTTLTGTSITANGLIEKRISSESVTVAKSGTLSIDPNNKNPTVKVAGIDWYAKANMNPDKNEIPGHSVVAITLSPGPDGSSIDTENVYAYLLETLPLDAEGNINLSTPAAEYKIDSADVSKSGDNRIVNYEIEKNRGTWYLVVDAIDKMGYTTTRRDENSTKTKNTGYGIFAFTINGAAPYFTGNKVIPATGKVRPDENDKNSITIYAQDADSSTLTLVIQKTVGTEVTESEVTITGESNGNEEPYDFEKTILVDVSAEDAGVVNYEFMLKDSLYSSSAITRTYTTDISAPKIISLSSPFVILEDDEIADVTNITASSTTINIAGYSDADITTANFLFTQTDATGETGTVPTYTSEWTEAKIEGLELDNKKFTAYLTLTDSSNTAAEGYYKIWYTFADDTGAYSEIKELCVVTLDLEPPVLVVTSPALENLNTGFTLAGTCRDSFGLNTLVITEETKALGTDSWSDPVSKQSNNYAGAPEKTWSLDKTDAGTGAYRYKITVVDKTGLAERTTEKTVIVYVDKDAPRISVDANYLSEGKWVNNTDYEVRMNVTDEGLGLASVEYTLDDLTAENVTWKTASQLTGSVYVAVLEDLPIAGGQKFTSRATDMAGNVTITTTITFGVDTTLPVVESFTLDNVTLSQTASSSYYKSSDYTLAGKITDAGSGIAKFTFSENGKTDTGVTLDEEGIWSKTLTTGSNNGTFRYVITARDNAGNEITLPEIVITVDTNRPSVDNIKPSKSASYRSDGQDVANNAYIVNGAIDINAVVSKTGITSVDYQIKGFGTNVTAASEGWTNLWKTGDAALTAGNIAVPLNTTASEYTDLTYYTVWFKVSDATYNGTNATVTSANLFIDQASDKPIVTVEGLTVDGGNYGNPTTDADKETLALKNRTNAFTFKLLDDDGINAKSLKIKIDGGNEVIINNGSATAGNEVSISHGFDFSDISGFDESKPHYLTVSVTDSDNTGTTTEFEYEYDKLWFWYDSGAPEIEFTSVGDVSHDGTTTLYKKDSFVLSGFVKETNNLKATSGVQYKLRTNEGTAQNWTDAIFDLVKDDNVDNKHDWSVTVDPSDSVKVTGIYLKAEDRFGNVSTTFNIVSPISVIFDKVAPTVVISNEVQGKYLPASVGGNLELSGTATESGLAGLSKVYYTYSTSSLDANDYANWTTIETSAVAWKETISNHGLTDGLTYNVGVRAEDNAGNISGMVTTTFTADLSAPTISFNSASGAYVNASGNGSFAIAGTVTDGNLPTSISWSRARSGNTGTADASGTLDLTSGAFNLQQSSLSDGTYTWTITATDKAGRTGTNTFVATIDATLPAVGDTIVVPTITETENASFTFSGTASDAGGLSEVKFKFSASGTEYTATGTESWLSTQTLATVLGAEKGSKTIYVQATDRAGNVSGWKTQGFVYDTEKPEIASTSSASQSTQSQNITLSGTASDDYGITSVTITENGEPLAGVSLTSGSWSKGNLPISSTNGTYNYVITATDSSGKTATLNRTIVLDNTAPVLEITAPAANESVATSTKTFKGTVSDAVVGVDTVTYTLTGLTGSHNAAVTGETWTVANVSLGEEGAKTLVVTAKDKLGNTTTEKTINFYYDKGAPTLTETEIGGSGLTTKANFTLGGTVIDTNQMSSITISAVNENNVAPFDAKTITKDGSNSLQSWEQEIKTSGSSPDITADGTYTFTITATDIAGQTKQLQRTIVVDTTAPTIVATDASYSPTAVTGTDTNSWYKSTSVTLSGLSVNDSLSGITSVEYTTGTTLTGTTIGGTGTTGSLRKSSDTWSGTISFQEGINYLRITATDVAGNTTQYPAGDPTVIYVDTTNPEISTTTTALTVNENSFTLAGTASDAAGSGLASVTISDGTNSYTDAGTSNWTKTFYVGTSNNTPKLTDGSYTFTFTAKDKTGYENKLTRSITVDTTKPVISSPSITTTDKKHTNGTDTWYGTSVIAISATVTDTNGTGVASMEYAVNTTSGTAPTSGWAYLTISGSTATASNVTIANGTNYIWLRATDVAGNVSTATNSLTAVADLNAPDTLTITKINDSSDNLSAQKYVKSGDTVKIEGTAADVTGGSGIASVSIVKIGSTAITDLSTTTTGAWTLTIPAAKLATGTVKVEAKDNLGFTTTFDTVVQLQLDTTEPTGSFTLPEADSTVNKTITVSGTANDNQTLSSVVLYYLSAANTWTEIGTATGTYNWSYSNFNTVTATVYDSNSTTAGTQMKIKAVVTDAAGNKIEPTCEVTVNQDSDRPTIKLTNIKPVFSGTAENLITLKMASTVYGTVSDDDGTVTSVKVSEDNSTWYDSTSDRLNVSSGVFDFTPSSGDGTKTLWFKVTDAKGTEFTTKAATAADGTNAQPYLQYATETAVSASDQIYFKVDTANPEFGTTVTLIPTNNAGTSDGTEITLTNSSKIGPTYRYFKIKATATDTNGIASITVKLDSGSDFTANLATAENVTTGTTGVIDFGATVESKYRTITLTVKDNPGLSATTTRTFIYDQLPPVIAITTPTSGSRVTGGVTIAGTATDNAESTGIATVKYMVPTEADAAGITGSSTGWLDIEGAGASWSLDLTTYDSDTAKYPLDVYADDAHGTEVTVEGYTHSNIWKIPIYFRIEDTAGNVLVYKDYNLEVNPDGDKPTVEVTYPQNATEDGAITTLGGSVRVTGTATDNDYVGAVYMQIDIDNDGFDAEDNTYLTTKGYSVTSFIATDSEEAWWGVEVDNTASWSKTINASGELYNGVSSNTIAMRFRAKDNNGKFGNWSDKVTVKLDSGAPTIESLKLVQKDAGGTVTATMDYSDDMWIRGKWYLQIAMKDDSYLKGASVQGITGVQGLSGSWTAENQTTKDHTLEIEIDTTDTTKFSASQSSIQSVITISDASIDSKRNISINYDNTAPTVGTFKHGDDEIGSSTKIVQSDGGYEIKTTVTDAGSGFDRVMLYFMRQGSDGNTKRIYNPILDSASRVDFTDADGNAITDYSIDSDGVPRFTQTVTRDSTTTLTYTGLGNNKNISKGTMVKIGGVDRLITAISDDVATIDSEVPTTYTSAEFAYALVIDHASIETAVFTDGSVSSITNDDGDGIAEGTSKSGTETTASVYINSNNIVDGKIYICYAAYDAAGNVTTGVIGNGAVETSVANNGPTITKVFLGTDLDGNGTVVNTFTDDNEPKSTEVIEYSATTSSKGTAEAAITADGSVEDVAKFIAKDLTTVKPEFVGGNGDLYYYLTIGGSAISNDKMRDNGTVSPASITVAQLDDYESTNTTDTANAKTLLFTVWDSTEEGTVGSTTLSATATVKMFIDVVDGIVPTASISPFYWNAEDDNSLYENSRANGHIDLPGTWNTNGDPSVSGKVVIRGKAFDESRLDSIVMSVDGYIMGATGSSGSGAAASTRTMATFTNGEWTGKVAGFDITKNVVNQTGHSVEWEYVWDSSLIATVTQNDVGINMSAKDSVNTTAATEYQVDVVPYIHGITRSASTYSNVNKTYRSTYGEYPVAIGDTLTVSGFNFASGTTAKIGSNSVTRAFVNSKELTITGFTKSGELVVTTNGITNVNATNDNAKAYNQDVDNVDYFDNRYIRVWDVNHYFSNSADGSNPTFAVDKKGNLFSTWALMGTASIQAQRGLNNTNKPIYVCYDQPDKENWLSVDKSADNGNLSVMYLPANVGSGGTPSSTGYADAKNIGGAWGTGFANDITTGYSRPDDDGNMAVKIDGNPYTQLDDNKYTAGWQLSSYAMRREVSQFKVPRTVRYGDNMHFAYYDTKNHALRYTYQAIDTKADEEDEEDNLAYRNTITGWILIDGTTDGQDRIHDRKNSNVDSVNPAYTDHTANSVTLSADQAISVGNTIGIAFQDSSSRYRFEIHEISSYANKKISWTDYAYDTTASLTGITIYKGDSNVVTGGVSRSSSAGLYMGMDVTSTGKPVIVYYDANAEGLRIAYTTSDTPSMTDITTGRDTWTRQTISGVAGGTYVQCKIDPSNYLHIVYRDSDGNLCYLKSTNAPDGEAYTFGAPMTIDSTGTYCTLSLIRTGSAGSYVYTPCVSFLNSEGTADGVKYAVLRSVDKGNATGTTITHVSTWDVQIVPAVVSSGNHYVSGGELVYVEGNSGSWTANTAALTDSVNTADCDAIVGFNTGRMDVVFLKEE